MVRKLYGAAVDLPESVIKAIDQVEAAALECGYNLLAVDWCRGDRRCQIIDELGSTVYEDVGGEFVETLFIDDGGGDGDAQGL